MNRSFRRKLQDYRGSPNSSASFGAVASLAGIGAAGEEGYWDSTKHQVGAGMLAVGVALTAAGIYSNVSNPRGAHEGEMYATIGGFASAVVGGGLMMTRGDT